MGKKTLAINAVFSVKDSLLIQGIMKPSARKTTLLGCRENDLHIAMTI